MSGDELELISQVFESNWIAPLGPQVDAFEKEFASQLPGCHAAALSSGTAALHLALRLLDVGPGDAVICSDLTFAASAFAIRYLGADPIFVDCDSETWNMSPTRLQESLAALSSEGIHPKAVVAVDLYGQSVDWQELLPVCESHEIPVIEDAAEALGAEYQGQPVGGFGRFGVFSFNGNKILTTSGGGMLVSDDSKAIERARYLASQARADAPHYEHLEVGYNYRLSNILAAVGRCQLRVLGERVAARRRIFEWYAEELGAEVGIELMPEAAFGRSSRWLTCITIEPDQFGSTNEDVRLALEAENIESRPVWKPMHLQKVFGDCRFFGSGVSAHLFERGLCLPSGSALTRDQVHRISSILRARRGSLR